MRAAGLPGLVAMGLAKVPALGVRLEVEPLDDVGRGRLNGHQNLFLRARTSANTSAAGFPASPTAAATSGTSARRNTLAFFSSPIVVGMVGSFRLISSAASSA